MSRNLYCFEKLRGWPNILVNTSCMLFRKIVLLSWFLESLGWELWSVSGSQKALFTRNGPRIRKRKKSFYISFSASEVEKVSKTTVEFLVDLKPVIQESLHKAIHWKTWDQLSTVQGPLSLKQLCQVNSKGPVSTGDPARIPRVIVGHDGDWLSVSPLALHHWVSETQISRIMFMRNSQL